MIVKNPKLEISAVSPKQYPTNGLSEIVLVGKSNVGKSSFINTMINRKKLARTSSEPGKTRQINFYNIDDKFYFVDLPGYGYSKMSKVEPGANDKMMYDYIIRSGLPFIVITSKADKIAVTKVKSAVDSIQSILNPIKDFTFLPFSAERKIYTDDVWKILDDIIDIEQ